MGHLSAAFARAVLLVYGASQRIMRAVGGDVHLFRVARATKWRAHRQLPQPKSDTTGDWSDIRHVLEDSTGRAARGGKSDIAVRGDRSDSDSRDWLSDNNDWLGIITHLHLSSHNAQ